MQRGIVGFTNQELKILHDLAISSGCQKEDLVAKIVPSGNLQNSIFSSLNNVLLSEDEAEILLDLMPIPNESNNSTIGDVRIKIQQFLAKSRFPQSSS